MSLNVRFSPGIVSRMVSIVSFALGLGLLLSACSNGSTDSNIAKTTVAAQAATPAATSPLLASLATNYPDYKLPANQAAAAASMLAQNPAVLSFDASTAKPASGQVSAQTSTTSTASYTAVQRAQNTSLTGSYFFSIYPSEMTTALATNPTWKLEGTAFFASTAASTELSPVWRFRNKLNGSYLYTL